MRAGVVIRFKRSVSLPRFSMDAGEVWMLGGSSVARFVADRKESDRFSFAGGSVLLSDVDVLFEGTDREASKLSERLASKVSL